MTDRWMQVYGLDRISRPKMNCVERVPEPDKILVVLVVARATPARAVEGIRRTGDRTEGDVPAANRKVAKRVSSVELELPRGQTNSGPDELRRESHSLGRRASVGPCVL